MVEAAEEKSFRAVFSWAWISIPTVNSQSFRLCLFDFGEDFRALAWSLSCLRRGTMVGSIVSVAVCNVRRGWVQHCAGTCCFLRHLVVDIWPPRRYLRRVEVGIRAIGGSTRLDGRKLGGYIWCTSLENQVYRNDRRLQGEENLCAYHPIQQKLGRNVVGMTMRCMNPPRQTFSLVFV